MDLPLTLWWPIQDSGFRIFLLLHLVETSPEIRPLFSESSTSQRARQDVGYRILDDHGGCGFTMDRTAPLHCYSPWILFLDPAKLFLLLLWQTFARIPLSKIQTLSLQPVMLNNLESKIQNPSSGPVFAPRHGIELGCWILDLGF